MGGWQGMDKAELKKRTKDFAHRCVKVSLALGKDALGNHIRKQLIRCSTSVAANYRATCTARSKAEFISKLGIVIEEADETAFWLEFLAEEGLLTKQRVASLMKEAQELTAIFIASQNTARKKT